MSNPLGRIVNRLAAPLGIEVRRTASGSRRPRCSLLGSLQTAAALGFVPATVLDIGAGRGLWTREASQIWPKARFLLVDPLEENAPSLAEMAGGLSEAAFLLAAAGREVGSTIIHVHPDLDGSSLYEEREETIKGKPRVVPATTVDDMVRDRGLTGPFLLKADVQGAELAVIEGAALTLAQTELIVLEVSLFDFFLGAAPQLGELVAAMGERGFVVWDIFGLSYRPIDQALSQVDMVFVRRDGIFRRIHQYATEEQRHQQLKRLAKDAPWRVPATDPDEGKR